MDFKVLLAQFMEDPSTGSTVAPPASASNGRNGKARKKLPNLPSSELPTITEPQDFRASMHWRMFRIMAELMDGWQFLTDFPNNVAIFGSSSIGEDHPWTKQAEELGKKLADLGYTIVTGGGPGIMQGANKGASEATDPHKGDSLGLNIKMSHFTRANPYVNKGVGFHYFFIRNLMILYSARAYIFFPGGLGTLDHASEIMTLIQTKKIRTATPVILFGKEFWQPIADWVDRIMYTRFNAIDKEDMQIYHITDSVDEIIELVKQSPERIHDL